MRSMNPAGPRLFYVSVSVSLSVCPLLIMCTINGNTRSKQLLVMPTEQLLNQMRMAAWRTLVRRPSWLFRYEISTHRHNHLLAIDTPVTYLLSTNCYQLRDVI